MGTRHILTLDSLCNSQTPDAEERIQVIPSDVWIARNSPPPPFTVRLAMRVSRSRCYSFLRRVFHYQNGSGSTLGPNPFDSKNWMLMEFVALTAQIVLIAYFLVISKREKPVWPMRIWVSGYSFACFLSLVLLYWRFRLIHLYPEDDTNESDIENLRSREDSRNLFLYMQKLRTRLELLFAIWFVMGNVWMFDSRFGTYHRAPKLHVLCVSLLAWNAVTYSFPFILFLLLCCCVPLLSKLIGYNMNTGSLCRGATEKQLSALRSWRFKGSTNEGDQNSKQECCICLAKYRDKDEIRQLPCCHIFHLSCVDQWLNIISCCPLCKQGIEK